MIVDDITQLTALFAGSFFDTAESAASDADLHMAHPVTVWRLPTGQFVWAATDSQEVVTDSCGLVRVRELCVDPGASPTEVMTRDALTGTTATTCERQPATSPADKRGDCCGYCEYCSSRASWEPMELDRRR